MTVVSQPTGEPFDAARRYAELRPLLDAIDLDSDLDEQDTHWLGVAMGVTAASGDAQVYGDEWIKLGVLVSRGVISDAEWRAMADCID